MDKEGCEELRIQGHPSIWWRLFAIAHHAPVAEENLDAIKWFKVRIGSACRPHLGVKISRLVWFSNFTAIIRTLARHNYSHAIPTGRLLLLVPEEQRWTQWSIVAPQFGLVFHTKWGYTSQMMQQQQLRTRTITSKQRLNHATVRSGAARRRKKRKKKTSTNLPKSRRRKLRILRHLPLLSTRNCRLLLWQQHHIAAGINPTGNTTIRTDKLWQSAIKRWYHYSIRGQYVWIWSMRSVFCSCFCFQIFSCYNIKLCSSRVLFSFHGLWFAIGFSRSR